MRIKQPDDLVLWLQLDEGSGTQATDLSNYNNHGKICGAQWTKGIVGNALSFDGVDDYVEMGDSDSLRVDRYVTMCAWIYGKKLEAGWNSVMSKGDGYAIYVKNDTFDVVTRGTGHPVEGYKLPYNFENNKWYFLTAIINTDELKIHYYVNGKLIGTIDLPSDYGLIYPSTTPFRVGYPRIDTLYFNGIIDEVRIYNRALSEAEIKQLYHNYLKKRNLEGE